MFLDNVVHDRAQVLAPWHEYRKEGNSLFVWMLALSAVVIAVVIAYLVQCITSLQTLYETSNEMTELIAKLRDEAGYTIIVIEHDMHVVEGISDRVIALDHGVKIAEGSFEQVATDPRVVEAYLGFPGGDDGA